jgi:hypothetical protein
VGSDTLDFYPIARVKAMAGFFAVSIDSKQPILQEKPIGVGTVECYLGTEVKWISFTALIVGKAKYLRQAG